MTQKLYTLLATALALVGGTASAWAASTSAAKFLDQPESWYRTNEALRIADNVLSHQSELGGWPKNVDTATKPWAQDRSKLRGTYDNKSTTDELRYLARMFVATRDERFKQAFDRGLDYVLKGQYPNGGWPQVYPPKGDYEHYITFNDSAMGRLMFFVREVGRDDRYDFVDEPRRRACRDAFDRGIQCILKCQIKVGDTLTAWCAQHDEKDFSPRSARTYELASLSGSESVGIVHVLMSVDDPGPEIVRAVDAAVAWFGAAKLVGIRTEKQKRADMPKADLVVVDDPSAPPMWARFYEIGTNQPIFCDRDGVPKHKLSEIGAERRNGYAWLGYWPQNLIAKEYPAWKAKLAARSQ